jgi:glycosyltransferase involved in cell wall biosynthesis
MRVAVLLPSLDAGGAQRQFVQLAGALAARGHEVLFVVCVPGGAHWEGLAGRAGVRRIALAPRPANGRLGIGPRLPTIVRRLAQVLRHNRIQIVYSALHIANLLAWLATAGGRTIPLCWGMRAARHELAWRQRLPLDLCRLISPSVALLVANSSAGLAAYRAQGFRPMRAEIVPNGIDVDRFRPDPAARERVRAEWGLPNASIAIGLVARLVPIKDHPTFLAAAARLRSSHPTTRFVLVGDRPSSHRQALAAEAARLGLAGHMVWAGERTDMAGVYSAVDVLCLSSVSEGFPNVLAEAMACGLPVVATDVGDARSIVGDLGEIVPPRDPDALATALDRCLSLGAGWRRDVGEAGRARIVALYSEPTMIARTEALLVETVGRAQPAPASRPAGLPARTIKE